MKVHPHSSELIIMACAHTKEGESLVHDLITREGGGGGGGPTHVQAQDYYSLLFE